MPVDDRPFSTRLNELRRDGGYTFRALAAHLAEQAEPGERGMTSGHLAGLTTGQRAATPEVISLVARGLGLPPESFVEWRLWQLQHEFDPGREDGLEAAVEAMHAHFARRAAAPNDSPPAGRESRRRARAVLSTAR